MLRFTLLLITKSFLYKDKVIKKKKTIKGKQKKNKNKTKRDRSKGIKIGGKRFLSHKKERQGK